MLAKARDAIHQNREAPDLAVLFTIENASLLIPFVEHPITFGSRIQKTFAQIILFEGLSILDLLLEVTLSNNF